MAGLSITSDRLARSGHFIDRLQRGSSGITEQPTHWRRVASRAVFTSGFLEVSVVMWGKKKNPVTQLQFLCWKNGNYKGIGADSPPQLLGETLKSRPLSRCLEASPGPRAIPFLPLGDPFTLAPVSQGPRLGQALSPTPKEGKSDMAPPAVCGGWWTHKPP